MVALDIGLRDNRSMDTTSAPEELAQEILHSADADWVRGLVDALDREVRVDPLRRLLTLWDLSNAAAARLFGVSRQAFAKWLTTGPPADRVDDVTEVDNITSLLDRYIKRERIPAVVRRPAATLGGKSVIETLEAGEYGRAAEAMADSFDIRRIQP